MEIYSCWTATHTDAGLSAAYGGTTIESRTRMVAPKSVVVDALFTGAPANGADQGSHPPRGTSA